MSQPHYTSASEELQDPGDFECDPDCEGGVLCDCLRKQEQSAREVYEDMVYEEMKDRRLGL